METPRKFIIAELSIRKLGYSSVLINLRGVSTKLYFNLEITMQTYKELKVFTNYNII